MLWSINPRNPQSIRTWILHQLLSVAAGEGIQVIQLIWGSMTNQWKKGRRSILLMLLCINSVTTRVIALHNGYDGRCWPTEAIIFLTKNAPAGQCSILKFQATSYQALLEATQPWCKCGLCHLCKKALHSIQPVQHISSKFSASLLAKISWLG